ncbi:MAG: esterase-like activity of phytase family protein [Burkholderiales bacterium]|nr:esterase-like activity of phytase family protein [Burkholderiales bacterium]
MRCGSFISAAVALAASTLAVAAFASDATPAVVGGDDAPIDVRTAATPAATTHRVLAATAQVDGVRIAELSGLGWDRDEQLLYAISDLGYVFHFRVRVEGDRIVAVDPVHAAPLVDAKATATRSGKGFNAEGLALVNAANGTHGDTELIVSLEGGGRPDIVRASPTGALVGRLAVPGPAGDASRYRKKGRGLEAVALHPRYGLMTAPESPLRGEPQDRHTLYADGEQWSFPRHAPDSRLKGFDVLPDGNLVVLERTRGTDDALTATLRRVDLASCVQPSGCATRTLAVLPAGPDNYEGMTFLDPRHVLLVSDNGGAPALGTSFVLVTLP